MSLDRTRSTREPPPRPSIKHSSTPEGTISRDWDGLCSRCKAPDLRKYFSHRSRMGVVDVPDVAHMTVNSACPLCRLFLHIYRQRRRFTSKYYSLTETISYPNLLSVTEIDEILPDSLLAVARSTAGIKPSQEVLLNAEIDFTQLTAWLDECCVSHISSCAKLTEPESILGMRVIDVHTRNIVPATLGFDYAALSYVWGVGDKGAAQVDFPNTAPKTIEDGLEVTKKLGIRYLWVDRYCIRQDRKDEKHDQISKMHLIYHNARITIIAAAGSGPEHGIPGIRGAPRIPQPHVDLEDGLLVAAFPHPTRVIKKSKWASRGWTYQEAAISRRRLAFTEYGAYFECNDPLLSEGIEEPIRRMIGKSPRKLQRRLCGGISAWSSHDIWQHISEFSKRNVSYQEDRMNALLGIFGALEGSLGMEGHQWGIPIHAFWTSAFFEGLMWDIKGSTGRNIQLPSWSWTGWKGEVGDHDCLYEKLRSLGKLSIKPSTINVSVELLNGDIVSLKKYYYVSGGSIKNELASKYIHIRAPTFKCRFSVERRYPDALSCQYYWSPVVFAHTRELRFRFVELYTLWQTKGTNLEERLATETWDVIFWRVHRNKAYFLVLYRFDDYVERFGHFWGDLRMFRELGSISKDRIFRLG